MIRAVRADPEVVRIALLQGPHRKMAKITIRDTGDGFSPTVLSNLFTPFFTTKQGGSGLGLATVKRIVEGLRGEILGRNHPDGGAEISILLHISPRKSPP